MQKNFKDEKVRTIGKAAIWTLLVALTVGCKVGPDYKRPVVNAPAEFKGKLAPDIAEAEAPASFAENDWTTIFNDAVLKELVQRALENNLDYKIAAQRVLEAQAQLGVVRSQQLPSVSAGGSYSALQAPSALVGNNDNGTPKSSFFNGGGPSASAAWNLDFWGLYRRQTEAARAEVLGSEWGRRAVRVSLIQSVAESYFRLRSLDAQQQITTATIAAREDSVKLTQALERGGAASRADLRQAEELYEAARANLPEIRRQVAVEENALSVLLGKSPGDIVRGLDIAGQTHPEEVPVGIPSSLLERRADIQQAEQRLVAANARIGVARAQYFPQLSLTSMGGAASNQLSSIFAGGSTYWYAAGSVTQPVFSGGRIRSNYRYSKAQQQEMLLAYQKSILNALKDVSNGLAAYAETRHYTERKADQVKAAEDAVRLAKIRYSGGNTSYLEVLTTDTRLYDAQLQLAQGKEREAASLVQLYAALGGGWR